LVDDLRHERLPDADAEIVDRALYLKEMSGRPVRFISDDQGMQFRARTAGLETYPSVTEDKEKPPVE
jgi:hypothetical protein